MIMEGIQLEDIKWAQEISCKIKQKMEKVARRNSNNIPYTTKEGAYDDCSAKDICWWTNGFWGGMMWQLYHATHQEFYKSIAIDNEHKLDQNLMIHQGMDHDSGFKWLPTAIADYKLTGNKASRNRGLLAADNLAGRYNIAGEFIRAWNDDGDGSKAGWAIIDCMMNLPLLYWAYDETKDPRYLQVAIHHAYTVQKHFYRKDGSVNHIVEFNPSTGEYVKSYGGQGYQEGSSWTRGQAWAIYGFVLSYIHTKEESFLEYARKTADYFIKNIPKKGFIPVDFNQPAECEWEDSTAAVIAACGLLEIAKVMSTEEGLIYRESAIRLLKAIVEKRCNWSTKCDNIVEKCTAAYHDKNHEFPIIYGDYFFIEAIWKLTGEELFIW